MKAKVERAEQALGRCVKSFTRLQETAMKEEGRVSAGVALSMSRTSGVLVVGAAGIVRVMKGGIVLRVQVWKVLATTRGWK